MGKSRNNQFTTVNIESSNLAADVFLTPKDRTGYSLGDTLTIPVYFYRISGFENINEYYNYIFNLDYELLKLNGLYIKIDHGIKQYISNEIAEKVNPLWDIVERMISPTARNIIDIFFRNQVLKPIDEKKDSMIHDKLVILLNMFWSKEKNLSISKNFCIKILSWLDKYFLDIYSSWNITAINPKLLFYGAASRDEAYFMILLSLLGTDILYYNSSGDDKFNLITDINKYSTFLDYPNKQSIKPFPVSLNVQRQETIAYKASTEIHEILHNEDMGSYAPWQFEDYNPVPCTLKTTYDELFIVWNEEARFRTGFEVKNGLILIPNIFAKINGTNPDLSIFWNNLDLLRQNKKLTIFKPAIPFTIESNYPVDLSLLNKDGSFNPDKVRSSKAYKLAYLRTAVQHLILDKINQLVLSTDIFKYEIQQNFKFKILYTILNIDREYLDLIQNFDFPLSIPKLVIFDSSEQLFSPEDIIIISFLYLLGFDIVILTPTGYNNIENDVNEKYYDIHKLSNFKFGLNPINACNRNSKKGFFNKLFS